MKHILFIDDLSRLVIKKDSSLLMALAFQSLEKEVYLLFEKDFYYKNHSPLELNVFEFKGSLYPNDFYLESFELTDRKRVQINPGDTIHMRLDPPFDSRYMRYCWMLGCLEDNGIRVENSTKSILTNNEKLLAYQQKNSLESFVGSAPEEFDNYINKLKEEGVKNIILKPLELYQGIGVEKASIENLSIKELNEIFLRKAKEYQGPVVTQPFVEEVSEGEVRSLYFKGKELGTILKVPQEGEFLANIAQGAKYHRYEMSPELKKEASDLSLELSKVGLNFIAYDILGGQFSEINVTCPGLVVEVSHAMEKNLALEICQGFDY